MEYKVCYYAHTLNIIRKRKDFNFFVVFNLSFIDENYETCENEERIKIIQEVRHQLIGRECYI